MTIKLSIAILYVPERRSRAEQLAEFLNVPVKLVMDNSGLHSNGVQKALSVYDSDATHHMLLEDDIIPITNGFLRGVLGAIKVRPDDSISFYNARKSALKAQERGEHWVRQNAVVYTYALAMPVSKVKEFLPFAQRFFDPKYKHGCVEWAMFSSIRGYAHYSTTPSLVEHGLPFESFMGHAWLSIEKRQAKLFDPDVDVSTIDWAKGLDNPVVDGKKYSASHKGDWAACKYPGAGK